MAQERFLDPPLADILAQWRHYLAVLNPQPGDRSLDVGCASGDATRLLVRDYPGMVSVIGIDAKPQRVAEAQANWVRDGRPPQLSFQQADARQLPFPDDHFDRVICAETLEWVKPPSAGLREMARVLKPGGRALVIHTDYDTQVFPATDRALNRRIVAAFTDSGPNGQIGRALYGLCRQLGLAQVEAGVYTLINTAWRPDTYAYRVAHMLRDWLAPTGAFTPAELDGWLADLAAAHAAGAFFYSVNRNLVTFTK